MTDTVQLVTLPGVDLIATGQWSLSTGEVTFTTDDLANAIDATSCPAVPVPVIKLGHVDPRFDGEPAVGLVKNMSLTAGGNKITGDLTGLPAWLGDTMATVYPDRSIEGTYDFVCQIGHLHPFVITGLALLGVASPGVGVLNSLDDVEALITAAAAKDPGHPWKLDLEGGPMADPVLAAGLTTEDVRRAYYDSPDVSYAMWITELQLDPLQLIVADEGTNKVYRVPITVKGSDLTFGDAVEVSIEYVDKPVKEPANAGKGGKGQLRWASKDESRKLPKATDPPKAPRALARLKEVRAQVADMDQDDNVKSMVAALDATLDQAADLIPDDTSSLDPDIAQSLDLVIAAESIADELMELLGIDDPDDRGDADAAAAPRRVSAKHGKFTGSHSHQHGAYGAQSGDQTHEHSHTHSGDGIHAHSHAAATGKGGSEVEFTDEQKANLRKALGLGENDELTEDAILTASAALREDADAKVSAGNRHTPAGVVQIDKETWDAMNKRVDAGERYRRQQEVKQRDEVIDAAIRAGKFTVARRSYWEKAWDKDPDNTRDLLAGLQKNTVPVGDIGSPGGTEEDEMDQEYRDLFPPGTYPIPGQNQI
jgi:hypothetical protein